MKELKFSENKKIIRRKNNKNAEKLKNFDVKMIGKGVETGKGKADEIANNKENHKNNLKVSKKLKDTFVQVLICIFPVLHFVLLVFKPPSKLFNKRTICNLQFSQMF